MASLVLAKSFLERYATLTKSVQSDVSRLLDKFVDLSRSKSIHLEPIKGSLDPLVRTVRINQGVRGIVAAPKSGDTFILIDVLPHDEATKWCLRKRLTVNHVSGALEVRDITTLAGDLGPGRDCAPGPQIFHERQDEDFTNVGIDRLFVPAIRALLNEGEVQEFAGRLPSGQGQALEMLAAGYSVNDALMELLADLPPATPDSTDVGEAVRAPASAASFYVVESAGDLAAALNSLLEHWRIFLHPTQKHLANKETFSGPARILGGPGTGKTVVALHRAVYLTGRLPSNGPKILLTTFTKGLASALREQLEALDPAAAQRIDIDTIDAVAYRIVGTAQGKRPRIVPNANVLAYCSEAISEGRLNCSSDFLKREWEGVVIARSVKTREEYFTTARAGRGVRISRSLRAQYWGAIERVTGRLRDEHERTHLQIAEDAAGYVSKKPAPAYAHIIVDEAQDLHPAQWRLIRALVPERPNDILIVGDPHQRIYDNRVTLSSVGISIRGRSSKLKLNYRTTHEILKWALDMLEGVCVDDLDDSFDDLRGYRSLAHGLQPTVMGYSSAQEELQQLVGAIRHWLDLGIPHSAIGVTGRTATVVSQVTAVLSMSGIATREIGDDSLKQTGVTVGTMHSMKGLEFRAVAVVAATRELLPNASAVTAKAEDPLQHDFDVMRERCLLFVACTRARDLLRVSWYAEPSPFIKTT